MKTSIFHIWTLVWAMVLGSRQVFAAEGYHRNGKGKETFYACEGQILTIGTFCTPTNTDLGYYAEYECFCDNANGLATMSGCYHLFNRNTTKIVKTFSDICEEYFGVTITKEIFEEAYENYTKYGEDPEEIEGFNVSTVVDVPLKLDEPTARLYKDAYSNFLGNYDDSLYYGAATLGYWLLVFLIATVVNWSKILFPGLVKKFVGPFSNFWRKHVTLKAANSRKKTKEQPFLKVFTFLVPSRLETMIIVGFAAVLIGVCSCHINYVEGDPVFATEHLARLRYTADRTGIVVSAFIPLLILFAGRNNFLQWLTRWDFATFILFHRWVGRFVFILVLIHGCCFSGTFVLYKDYASAMKETYVIWGTVGLVAGSVIMFQGMLFLRRRWYEIFLLFHIILAGLFIGGAWRHVRDLGYIYFYYATVAVWAFDRAVRLGRLAVFGFPKAEVILLADETLKVVVPKPSYWKSIPGGHAFIHFLRPSCFWQSHPFTFTETAENKNKIVLYCKVKGGVTHGLYQYLATHPGRTTQIRVALEGPYGEATAAKKYDSAVFVAGGNGIPGIYSEITDLAKKSSDNIKQSLKLVWIVREYRSLYWFYEELLALKNTKIQTTIYITRPTSHACIEEFNNRIPFIKADVDTGSKSDQNDEIAERKFEEDEDKSDSIKKKDGSFDEDETSDYSEDKQRIIDIIKSELSHITFNEGRPSMEELVQQEIQESNGSIAFVTCGHPVMVDDLRYSVVENLDKSDGKRLEFFEQLQVWA